MSCGRTPWSCCGGITPVKRENRHKVLWGCNPRYDRVAAVKELQQRHPEWKIEPAGEGGQEYILVVCGCTAVCAAMPT